MIDWTELLSNALVAVLTIAVPVLMKFLIDWLKAKAEQARQYVGEWKPELTSLLEEAAEFGVKYAEQIDLAGMLQNFYTDKRSAAIDAAERWLSTKDLEEFDPGLLVMLIEKAVIENFPKNK